MTMDFGGITHSISVRFEDGTLKADVSVGGQVVRTVDLPEHSRDESFLALARGIDADQVRRATKSQTFKVGRRAYTIYIWPVGRCFKTQVHSDEGSSEVISWLNDGQFNDLAELFDVMKSQVRMGNVEFTSSSNRHLWQN